jgi:lipopolysaccharide/colanic/teichoic acid biosynthesis glycosyltransferase
MFFVVKFRTMFTDAERHGTITTSTDSRITPIGRWLRRYKLDEFPQLWNVLIGKMSFVGPRPDVPGYADRLEGVARTILELRPGITGPASLYFRNEEDLLASSKNPKEYNDTVIWPKKVDLNMQYVETWSFWKDIGYILITVVPLVDKWLKLVKRAD